MKQSFPIQVLQEGGEISDPNADYKKRIHQASQLQAIDPAFMRGVQLGKLDKKKKPDDQSTQSQTQMGQGYQQGGQVNLANIAGGNKGGGGPYPFGAAQSNDPIGFRSPFTPHAGVLGDPAQRGRRRPRTGQRGYRVGGAPSWGGAMFQEGGEIPQPRGTDTVPIMATPGEFVLNRGAVETAGRPFLHYLNELGKEHPVMGTTPKNSKKTFPVQYRYVGGPTEEDAGGGLPEGGPIEPDILPGNMPGSGEPAGNWAASPVTLDTGSGSPTGGVPIGGGIPNVGAPFNFGPGGWSLGGGPQGGRFDPREIQRGLHMNRMRQQHFMHQHLRNLFHPRRIAGTPFRAGALTGG